MTKIKKKKRNQKKRDQIEISVILIEKKYKNHDMGDKIEKHKFFDKREKKRIKSRRTELKNLHLQIRIYGLN
jgi:hypothetical protein